MVLYRIFASIALGTVAFATPALAITTITTSSYAIFSDIAVLNAVGVGIGPLAATSGTASPGYTSTNAVASLDADIDFGTAGIVSSGLGVNTGLLTGTSTANGVAPGDTTVGSGRSQVDNLELGLFTRTLSLPGVTTLGIQADTISSLTGVTVIGNTAVLTGQSVFENLDLTLLGLVDFALGANAQVAANTSLINLGGISILLNEQIVGGNGTTIQSLTTNALSITLNNYLLGGQLLSGRLVIGNSFAEVRLDEGEPDPTVPEPAVWLQLIAGFGMTGLVVRRRRAAARA